MAAKTPQGGRIVKRWVATCAVVVHDDRRSPTACGFNDRDNPRLHTNPAAATRESVTHLVQQHDLHGAREVQVRRTYTLAREEVLS